MPPRLLIIEDDRALGEMLAMHFEDLDFAVTHAERAQAGLDELHQGRFDLVLLDQQLPDGLGSELIGPLLEIDPQLPILMMTGKHDLELAIAAIQRGAADFVHKPIKTDELTQAVQRLLREREALSQTSDSPPASSSDDEAPRDLIGRSDAMLSVSKAIARSARTQATVLISGESGTGKEVVARLIHQHSGRAGAFIAVNCAAIVDTLLESDLFGHEKGAFTGAQARKQGRFEQAAGGTLFLDEIGELAPALQAKLLRVLQEHVFERVGGHEAIHTDARIIAATNRDLLAEASAGRFREDLVYRLQVIQIRMPPLRERREDIPLLVQGLLARIAARLERPIPTITPAALARLSEDDWPGNVRELENRLSQALLQTHHALITPEMLELGGGRAGQQGPLGGDAETASGRHASGSAGDQASVLRSLDEVAAAHIQQVLDHTQGHKGQACEILGISRPALDRKIEKYQLRVLKR
ncbi:sigma-54-dependent Fis family transcriptional regulator [Lamprobacter modestohalophilus]|uniref:Sigma-54-dependent Fis family transcriptional regulator n=1 Tax=Lamprobacter modestohalophilus TaxID=1064514 RepID=A0A9X0WEL6_9GAMM|nr:sigma-54 dependent transcriptional regulator [Lamprobacter modestohalophilus]MBK1621588.1 sigma-54-dependent Fis family transcriptional regulator [Lamprobacter modestohalophilus]